MMDHSLMSDNPLAQPRPRPPMQTKGDPMQRHAAMWAHMQQQPQDVLQKHVAMMDYALPVIGRSYRASKRQTRDSEERHQGCGKRSGRSEARPVAGRSDDFADSTGCREGAAVVARDVCHADERSGSCEGGINETVYAASPSAGRWAWNASRGRAATGRSSDAPRSSRRFSRASSATTADA